MSESRVVPGDADDIHAEFRDGTFSVSWYKDPKDHPSWYGKSLGFCIQALDENYGSRLAQVVNEMFAMIQEERWENQFEELSKQLCSPGPKKIAESLQSMCLANADQKDISDEEKEQWELASDAFLVAADAIPKDLKDRNLSSS